MTIALQAYNNYITLPIKPASGDRISSSYRVSIGAVTEFVIHYVIGSQLPAVVLIHPDIDKIRRSTNLIRDLLDFLEVLLNGMRFNLPQVELF